MSDVLGFFFIYKSIHLVSEKNTNQPIISAHKIDELDVNN